MKMLLTLTVSALERDAHIFALGQQGLDWEGEDAPVCVDVSDCEFFCVTAGLATVSVPSRCPEVLP